MANPWVWSNFYYLKNLCGLHILHDCHLPLRWRGRNLLPSLSALFKISFCWSDDSVLACLLFATYLYLFNLRWRYWSASSSQYISSWFKNIQLRWGPCSGTVWNISGYIWLLVWVPSCCAPSVYLDFDFFIQFSLVRVLHFLSLVFQLVYCLISDFGIMYELHCTIDWIFANRCPRLPSLRAFLI